MSERFEISRELRFESAHFLPQVPEDHKCRRLHGHSFAAEVWVIGELDDAKGWVIDFADLDRYLQPIHLQLDHQLLNDVPGLENPTSEEIGRWLWKRCVEELPARIEIARIVIRETCESIVVYRGDNVG